jgi:hypothetical protein
MLLADWLGRYGQAGYTRCRHTLPTVEAVIRESALTREIHLAMEHLRSQGLDGDGVCDAVSWSLYWVLSLYEGDISGRNVIEHIHRYGHAVLDDREATGSERWDIVRPIMQATVYCGLAEYEGERSLHHTWRPGGTLLQRLAGHLSVDFDLLDVEIEGRHPLNERLDMNLDEVREQTRQLLEPVVREYGGE